MKKIMFILSFLLIISIFLIEPLAMANAEIIATPPANDITRLVWVGSSYSINVGAYTPEIDLIKIEYSINSQGNATVTLTYQNTPLLSNHTYYWIYVTDSVSDFTFSASLSGLAVNSNDYYNVLITTSYDTNSAAQTLNATSIISGNTIVLTFPSEWTDTSSIGWNTTAPTTWSWEVYSREWINTTKSNTNSGIWYYDYWPATDNPFNSTGANSTNSSNNSSGKPSPGFEFITIVAGFFVVIPVYIYKRNRSIK